MSPTRLYSPGLHLDQVSDCEDLGPRAALLQAAPKWRAEMDPFLYNESIGKKPASHFPLWSMAAEVECSSSHQKKWSRVRKLSRIGCTLKELHISLPIHSLADVASLFEIDAETCTYESLSAVLGPIHKPGFNVFFFFLKILWFRFESFFRVFEYTKFLSLFFLKFAIHIRRKKNRSQHSSHAADQFAFRMEWEQFDLMLYQLSQNPPHRASHVISKSLRNYVQRIAKKVPESTKSLTQYTQYISTRAILAALNQDTEHIYKAASHHKSFRACSCSEDHHRPAERKRGAKPNTSSVVPVVSSLLISLKYEIFGGKTIYAVLNDKLIPEITVDEFLILTFCGSFSINKL
ncbi:hypothetical protein VP01_1749g1 [Puccinia sorghi]|uniref:Uncharacterized protein n=1 Tax=Puccinia sorghi TaxID=27349 RepID=A0A0L6VF20_9BASI|nr:hypothetical protein VP01_1749g1 [Puccinia sorghi]